MEEEEKEAEAEVEEPCKRLEGVKLKKKKNLKLLVEVKLRKSQKLLDSEAVEVELKKMKNLKLLNLKEGEVVCLKSWRGAEIWKT